MDLQSLPLTYGYRHGNESLALRELLRSRRDEIQAVLDEYHAANLRVFGSVARGEAGPRSDIDLLVDLLPDDEHGELFRVGGLRAVIHHCENTSGQPLGEEVAVRRTPPTAQVL